MAPVLEGRRIIITRSVADNRSLAAELVLRGGTPVELPLVEVAPPGDDQELVAALDRIDGYRWVVLTSVNGVEAVRRVLGATDWPPGTEVVPVGPATAAAARAAGMLSVDPPPVATAAALVEAFTATDRHADGIDVLAPLAELAGSTVEDGLRAKGYRVTRVTAYRTVAPETTDEDRTRLAAAREADAVTFFSPSVVDRFPPELTPPVVVCIGPSTAARVAERGLAEPIVASSHTQAGVVEALVDALGSA